MSSDSSSWGAQTLMDLAFGIITSVTGITSVLVAVSAMRKTQAPSARNHDSPTPIAFFEETRAEETESALPAGNASNMTMGSGSDVFELIELPA
ncbi:hypothetical protein CMQ_1162 [Grosmannia clavigera kw1407]|uniref:Uncharacterized protein n=1 Tax=Grosmannia clavigera (strain kw1407 / UAMH 11150) TaxID=655863 RepID=F0XEK7_GROCL|nr:uncharacterized protein CMQ_1162 [Grosmannia clavigera kw1407]EFX04234.1 hypothetical protein CMQ_1162 [Grosmannia clavigera kw1407]